MGGEQSYVDWLLLSLYQIVIMLSIAACSFSVFLARTYTKRGEERSTDPLQEVHRYACRQAEELNLAQQQHVRCTPEGEEEDKEARRVAESGNAVRQVAIEATLSKRQAADVRAATIVFVSPSVNVVSSEEEEEEEGEEIKVERLD